MSKENELVETTRQEQLLAQVSELNQMLVDNKPLEAFEKFYGSITELRRNSPLKVAVGDEITMVEWLMDFTHTEWGPVILHQVSVQVWADDQIIKENFFYSLK